MKPVFSISCRYIGIGGTTVSFYTTPTGLKAIWQNETCPDEDSEIDPITGEADDGHNVSFVKWEDFPFKPKKG